MQQIGSHATVLSTQKPYLVLDTEPKGFMLTCPEAPYIIGSKVPWATARLQKARILLAGFQETSAPTHSPRALLPN